MAKPSKGDLVLIEYTLWAEEDGKLRLVDTTSEELAQKEGIFDSKRRYGEVPVLLGVGSLLDPIEEALLEMEEGEEREIEIPPERGYGERRRELIVTVSKKKLREAGIRPVVGEEIEVNGRRGRIIRVTDRFVTIDFNHPLAGKKLRAKIKLVRIVREEPERIKLLAVRHLRLPEDSIKVEGGEGEYTLVLPSDVLILRDLEAILMQMLDSIYRLTNARKIRIVIDVEFKREEAAEKEAESGEESREEATQEASEG